MDALESSGLFVSLSFLFLPLLAIVDDLALFNSFDCLNLSLVHRLLPVDGGSLCLRCLKELLFFMLTSLWFVMV